jgi:hypothetical protein
MDPLTILAIFVIFGPAGLSFYAGWRMGSSGWFWSIILIIGACIAFHYRQILLPWVLIHHPMSGLTVTAFIIGFGCMFGIIMGEVMDSGRVKANCPRCGTPYKTRPYAQGPDLCRKCRREYDALLSSEIAKQEKTIQCGQCSGTGRIKDHKCVVCKGTGRIERSPSEIESTAKERVRGFGDWRKYV